MFVKSHCLTPFENGKDTQGITKYSVTRETSLVYGRDKFNTSKRECVCRFLV